VKKKKGRIRIKTSSSKPSVQRSSSSSFHPNGEEDEEACRRFPDHQKASSRAQWDPVAKAVSSAPRSLNIPPPLLMKLIHPLAYLCLASLIGCAVVNTGGQVWYKEGATAREQEAALAAAEAQAAQAHVKPPEERSIVIRNMTAQGWRLISKDSAPPPKSENTHPLPPPVKPGPSLR
jgi:hypothetical protein